MMFAISAFALIKAVQVYAKENSVGKTAMDKFKAEAEEVKKDFEHFKKEHKELKDDVEHIEHKYEKLIEKILNNFPFSK